MKKAEGGLAIFIVFFIIIVGGFLVLTVQGSLTKGSSDWFYRCEGTIELEELKDNPETVEEDKPTKLTPENTKGRSVYNAPFCKQFTTPESCESAFPKSGPDEISLCIWDGGSSVLDANQEPIHCLLAAHCSDFSVTEAPRCRDVGCDETSMIKRLILGNRKEAEEETATFRAWFKGEENE